MCDQFWKTHFVDLSPGNKSWHVLRHTKSLQRLFFLFLILFLSYYLMWIIYGYGEQYLLYLLKCYLPVSPSSLIFGHQPVLHSFSTIVDPSTFVLSTPCLPFAKSRRIFFLPPWPDLWVTLLVQDQSLPHSSRGAGWLFIQILRYRLVKGWWQLTD